MTSSSAHSANTKNRLAAAALLTPVFLLLALFVVRYIRQENFIYYWDYAQYHDYYMELGTRFAANPFRALDVVLRSVRKQDYNLLPTLFLLPLRLVLGPGRLAYILSMTVIFVFPSTAIFSLLVKKLRGGNAVHTAYEDIGLTVISVLALATLPQLWIPVLLGYIDVGGLIIIFAVLLLYFRADFAKQNCRNLMSIALLLSLLILYRRWYAYWVVGFFGALAVSEGMRFARDTERRAQWKVVVKNALALGVVSNLSIFLIATPIARRMLSTDYRDIYSAYRSSHPFAQNFAALGSHFGLLTLILAGLGIVFSGMRAGRRPLVYFLCVQFVIAFALFTRTQNFVVYVGTDEFGGQHIYGALAAIALFLALFVQDVFLRAKTGIGKAAVLVVFLIMCAANFSATFLPGANPLPGPVEFALPRVRQYPMVRTDLDQLRALLDALTDITRDSESTIYILASSYRLNSSIVHEACMHLDPAHGALAHKIAATNDVDKRDGFPIPFLMARYVVLTLPTAYHLAPQDQRVIGVLAEQLVKDEGIGKFYEKMNFVFRLEDGSSVVIYKKVRPLDPGDVKSLSDKFLEFYPSHKELFVISPDVIRQVSAL
ncbi:MAG: hypothetical protein LAO08_11170 [Acidobacteriia bacterium]|nr:hypothetical protein [Terriglobia bacterium]